MCEHGLCLNGLVYEHLSYIIFEYLYIFNAGIKKKIQFKKNIYNVFSSVPHLHIDNICFILIYSIILSFAQRRLLDGYCSILAVYTSYYIVSDANSTYAA